MTQESKKQTEQAHNLPEEEKLKKNNTTTSEKKEEQEDAQKNTEQTQEKQQEEKPAHKDAEIASGTTSPGKKPSENQDQPPPASTAMEAEQKADELPEPTAEKPVKGPVEEKSDDPVVSEEPVKKHPAGNEEQQEISDENKAEKESSELKTEEKPDAGQKTEEQSSEKKSSTASSDEREYYDFGEDTETDEDEDEVADEETEEESADKEKDILPEYDTLSREQLVEELEKLVAKDDPLNYKTEITLIKVAYLKKTDIEKAIELEKLSEETAKKEEEESKEEVKEEKKPQKDELSERFNAAFDLYKEKRRQYREEQEKLQQENLEKKKAILEELRDLINSEETLKKTYDDFKALQEKWKDIGMVPKADVNELWKNYHFLVEKFFDKVKINKELRDLDLKKNLEQKIELCEKAEELILEKSINKSFKELQALHEKYRQTGPVPTDVKEEVWNRFKSATEKIHDRRRTHYQELEEQQQKNLDAKTALCEKMENLIKTDYNSVKEWNQANDHVKEMMNLWRSIGFVPKQYNESIWNRFKTSVDSFYDNKKEFFKELKDEQRDNYNRKLNLCLEAEALKDSTDWKKTTSELINLQKEWKKVGPVSRKHSDKLWKRFRAANDKFFNSKDEYFKNRKDREKENLQKKQELIEKIKTYEFSENKNDNLKMLKDIQREWMSIGFVPFDKKDKTQKEYQEIINKRMDELSISNADVNSSQYKSHVNNLKEMPGGERQLRKERGSLFAKVNKLKEDVKLWENNTGFLANTKNADILKKEFQNKIDRAKREIALLEAQIKILDE